MYEVDVLKAGQTKDADAITARFARPDTREMAHVVVDAGWQEDGPTVVGMVRDRYGSNRVDLAILTHPDGDHIGGMGAVVRELDVNKLLLHRLDLRGGYGLPAADAVAELAEVAAAHGTTIIEPRPGLQALGGAVTILGPDDAYYEQLVAEQQAEAGGRATRAGAAIAEAFRSAADRFLEMMPFEEIPFDDGSGCGPRNNSSVITLLTFDGQRALLTGDAGVAGVSRALDYAELTGINSTSPDLMHMPHHGSRRNASSAFLNRVLGPIGPAGVGAAFVNVATTTDQKHPAGRVVNAYRRRGYPTWWTAGNSLCWSSPDAPPRHDYGPLDPLPPMQEADDDA